MNDPDETARALASAALSLWRGGDLWEARHLAATARVSEDVVQHLVRTTWAPFVTDHGSHYHVRDVPPRGVLAELARDGLLLRPDLLQAAPNDERRRVRGDRGTTELGRAVSRPPDPVPFAGTTLPGDRFLLLAEIGKGAFSRVFRCHDQLRLTDVAVKVLFPNLVADQRALDSLRAEVRASSRLGRHVGLLRRVELGEYQQTHFLVMDYVDGADLAQVAAVPMPIRSALRIGAQVAGTLAHTHRRDVLHRDLKPENIIIPHDGRHLKVVDFGVSHCLQSASVHLTKMTVSGTPKFMAPEVFLGKGRRKSDIYALGTIMYELLCGCSPFAGTEMFQLFAEKQDRARTYDPRAISPHVPAAVAALVQEMLSFEPDSRPSAETVETTLLAERRRLR